MNGLSESITQWCTPEQRTRKRDAKKFDIINYLTSNWTFVIFMSAFIGMNVILFVTRGHFFATHSGGFRNNDGSLNVYIVLARANGLVLNFNSMMIVFFIMRYTITIMRKLGLVLILPLDHHVKLHKWTGILIFVQGWFHTLMHVLNYCEF